MSPSSGLKSALKMETLCFSETLASTNESTRRQNPEQHHHQIYKLFPELLVTKYRKDS
jgi:hypothetical protein